MPTSMATGFISLLIFKQGWVAPYPTGIFHALNFILVLFVILITSYIILKKQIK